MSELLRELIFPVGMVVFCVGMWITSRASKGSEDSIQQSFAFLDQALEEEKKRAERENETLAVNRKLVEQGDETIALLQAIKENLENRTIKN